MKSPQYYNDQNQKPAGAAREIAVLQAISQNEHNFPPLPHEIAGRAYSSFVRQGSRHGHDEEHWLNAESELLAERKLTRTHGYANKK